MFGSGPSGAANAHTSAAKPSIGSLFVPRRVSLSPRQPHNDQSPPPQPRDSGVCHISSVQRPQLQSPIDASDLRSRFSSLLAPASSLMQLPLPKLPALPLLHLPPSFESAALVLDAPPTTAHPAPPPPAVTRPPACADADAARPALRFSWAGSGIYFFWQLGAMQWLMERYDVSKVPMAGASGGGLVSVLGACGVDAEHVYETAYQMSVDNNIWERPAGLVGMWGPLIEEWLDALLPADAADICRDSVEIVVTQLPFCNQVAVSDFTDKADLIAAAMASAHVPLALDWRMSRELRGVPCVDGSFPDFFSGANSPLLLSAPTIMFDYFEDPALVRNGRMDMLSVKSPAEVRRLMAQGRAYAQRLADAGALEGFDDSAAQRHAAAVPTRR